MGESFGDTELQLTLLEAGTPIIDAWFGKTINVRTSKPSIVTTGGGASFITDTNKIANIGNVITG